MVLFGILDLLAALVVILATLAIVPFRIVLGFAMYLLIKGIIFKGDFASFIDIVIAILLIIIYFVKSSSPFFIVLSVVIAIYLVQKGFFSFVRL
jgi:hypothetical protein